MRKKRILIGLIVLVIAVLLCALIMKFFSKRNNTDEVVLSTNNGINYSWKCEVENDKIATIFKKYTEEVDTYIDGGEVLLHYVIKGKKQGETKLICDYKNPNEEYSVETNIYQINVDNKLNVKIINSY
jgi:predicted secreted protein